MKRNATTKADWQANAAVFTMMREHQIGSVGGHPVARLIQSRVAHRPGMRLRAMAAGFANSRNIMPARAGSRGRSIPAHSVFGGIRSQAGPRV